MYGQNSCTEVDLPSDLYNCHVAMAGSADQYILIAGKSPNGQNTIAQWGGLTFTSGMWMGESGQVEQKNKHLCVGYLSLN